MPSARALRLCKMVLVTIWAQHTSLTQGFDSGHSDSECAAGYGYDQAELGFPRRFKCDLTHTRYGVLSRALQYEVCGPFGFGLDV